jgi:hypothetical protein
MFLEAKSYEDAHQSLVLQDPLVAKDCVDWELNGWIGQVGDKKKGEIRRKCSRLWDSAAELRRRARDTGTSEIE